MAENQNSKAADREKLISIDIARGLAALSVFIYHYGIGQTLAKYTGMASFDLISIPGADYGVTLFFVISGFCIHGSEWRRLQVAPGKSFDLLGYFERRIRRIYPVYLFALVLSIALGLFDSVSPSPSDLALHIFLLHGFSVASFNSINVVLWTISIEACFYVIYPVWLNYRLKAGLNRAFGLGNLLSVGSLLFASIFLYPYNFPVRWFFLNTWGGWLLGALLAETIASKRGFYLGILWWITGLLFWSLGIYLDATHALTGRWLILQFPMRVYLCAWPLSALVLVEGWFRSRSIAGLWGWPILFFSWVGLASYSLYLLHEPLIDLRNLLQRSIPMGVLKLPFQILWIPVVLAICGLSYHYLELRFMRSKKSRVPISPVISSVPNNG